MEQLIIRNAMKKDMERMVEIYNSNPIFLRSHLGKENVDVDFVQQGMTEMDSIGFLSGVIEEENRIVGVLDYREDDCVYLSLLMLDAQCQGKGMGSKCYKLFEAMMREKKRRRIRIDVVCKEPENPLSFWKQQGFREAENTRLTWENKESQAVVMYKEVT